MQCEDCQGLGYREYEHGLIRLSCKPCEGTGSLSDPPIPTTWEIFKRDSAFGVNLLFPRTEFPQEVTVTPYNTDSSVITNEGANLIKEVAESSLQEGGIVSDPELGIINRTGQPDIITGGGDTGQPGQPQKPKARKQTRKRVSKVL